MSKIMAVFFCLMMGAFIVGSCCTIAAEPYLPKPVKIVGVRIFTIDQGTPTGEGTLVYDYKYNPEGRDKRTLQWKSHNESFGPVVDVSKGGSDVHLTGISGKGLHVIAEEYQLPIVSHTETINITSGSLVASSVASFGYELKQWLWTIVIGICLWIMLPGIAIAFLGAWLGGYK